MRWALLTADGGTLHGVGREALKHGVTRAAIGGVFQTGEVTIYVAGGPDLLWTVEQAMGATASLVYWGFGLPPGARLWVSPRGMIGVGASVEAVEGVFRRLVEATKRTG